MNLPPTLQAFIGRSTDDAWLVQAVAHEACRLQREACEAHFSPDMTHTPLVVPSPEEK